MQAYAGTDQVVFLGIEDGSTLDLVRSWIAQYGWTFPVGVKSPADDIYALYGAYYDNFFVIGRDGVITQKLTYGTEVDQVLSVIPAAVDDALAHVPVRPATWGRMKRRYR